MNYDGSDFESNNDVMVAADDFLGVHALALFF